MNVLIHVQKQAIRWQGSALQALIKNQEKKGWQGPRKQLGRGEGAFAH